MDTLQFTDTLTAPAEAGFNVGLGNCAAFPRLHARKLFGGNSHLHSPFVPELPSTGSRAAVLVALVRLVFRAGGRGQ